MFLKKEDVLKVEHFKRCKVPNVRFVKTDVTYKCEQRARFSFFRGANVVFIYMWSVCNHDKNNIRQRPFSELTYPRIIAL